MASPPPPIPPLPTDFHQQRQNQPPPTLPPLPPNFRFSQSVDESPPHFADPLVAPRPHRLDPGLPAHVRPSISPSEKGTNESVGKSQMARTLDEQVSPGFRGTSPQPPQPAINQNPGFFAAPTQTPAQQYASSVSSPPISLPTPQPLHPHRASAQVSPPPPAMYQDHLAASMAALAFQPQPPSPHELPDPYAQHEQYPPQQPQLPPGAQPAPGVPALTQPLPTIENLAATQPAAQTDAAAKLAWARDVLFLVERAQGAGAEPASGPAAIGDAELARLAPAAVSLVLALAAAQPPLPEAVYLRATLAASGAFPELVKQNPRAAFRDFEAAARGGYAAAWFRLGRDYENFNDHPHAKDCFERGAKAGVESCVYRIGMANLMGQLSFPANPAAALPHLSRAALLATAQVPQPAYVYALLLLGEFAHVAVPPAAFAPYIPPGSSPGAEARRHLERAAYLNFAPAQYKLGHAYEFAQPPPFPFDPLLS
ncbi:hypothetical protein HWV62_24400, partial [Athelia sp. TMB]